MITKQKYIEYLISTPINYTCFNLSEHLDNVSHDVVSNFLKRNRITTRQIWAQVKGLVKNTPDAYLISTTESKTSSIQVEIIQSPTPKIHKVG